MTRVYAEFASSTALIETIHALRAKHVPRLEAYLPYPVPAVDDALGAEPSRLSHLVFAAGIGAAAAAYGLQWLLQARLYPLNVGGRPNHFPLAFVPITFEMGVLFASLTAFVAVLVGGGLLRLWHPSSDVDGIDSATGTRFWLEARDVEGEDAIAMVTRVMRDGGALAVRRLGGAS
ncbi:MAG: DUF3341 domain-containing protein [Deltaproteobacteria bacterium]|nr:DUF3341 domain-containing protein [Deltaproteobacteria bacterium]